MNTQTTRIPSERRGVFLLSLGHCINDLHAAFLPTLLPRLVEVLQLSLTQAGFFGFINGITHVIAQPLLGHAADTTNRPWYIAFGPVVTALGMGLLPYAPSYGAMLLCMVIYSMGSAAFHPQGGGSVGIVASPERLAFGVSIFNVGGMIGGTLSPYYAILLISFFGLKGLPITVIPTILFCFLVLWLMPFLGELPGEAEKKFRGNALQNISRVLRGILPIWSVSFLRNASTRTITFFLPLLIASRGGTLLEGGTALFVTSLTGTVAAMAGAKAADKIGKRLFIGTMYLLGPFFLAPAIYMRGLPALGFFTLGLSVLRATIPVTAAIAIERNPESRSVASSLMMGVSWGLAGLVTFPLGSLADTFGIETAMAGALILVWVALPVLYRHKILGLLKR